MQERRKTAVGRIAKSFGLSGELMVSLFDTFPADFDTKEPLFVVIDKLAVPLFATVSSAAEGVARWSYFPISIPKNARTS